MLLESRRTGRGDFYIWSLSETCFSVSKTLVNIKISIGSLIGLHACITFSLCSHMALPSYMCRGRGIESNSRLSGVSSYQDTILLAWGPSSWPHPALVSASDAPCSHIATLGIRASTQQFGKDTHIESITDAMAVNHRF